MITQTGSPFSLYKRAGLNRSWTLLFRSALLWVSFPRPHCPESHYAGIHYPGRHCSGAHTPGWKIVAAQPRVLRHICSVTVIFVRLHIMHVLEMYIKNSKLKIFIVELYSPDDI